MTANGTEAKRSIAICRSLSILPAIVDLLSAARAISLFSGENLDCSSNLIEALYEKSMNPYTSRELQACSRLLPTVADGRDLGATEQL